MIETQHMLGEAKFFYNVLKFLKLILISVKNFCFSLRSCLRDAQPNKFLRPSFFSQLKVTPHKLKQKHHTASHPPQFLLNEVVPFLDKLVVVVGIGCFLVVRVGLKQSYSNILFNPS